MFRFGRKDFKVFADKLVLEMGQPFDVVSELLLLGALEVQPRDKEEFALLKEIKVQFNALSEWHFFAPD